MNEAPQNRRQTILRLVALFALAVVLAAVALGIPFLGRQQPSTEPLNPNDPIGGWPAANPEQKRVTAELLLDQMHEAGNLGSATEARFNDPRQRQKMIDDLIAALDAASDRNHGDYVSPSLSISFAATRATTLMGWRE